MTLSEGLTDPGGDAGFAGAGGAGGTYCPVKIAATSIAAPLNLSVQGFP